MSETIALCICVAILSFVLGRRTFSVSKRTLETMAMYALGTVLDNRFAACPLHDGFVDGDDLRLWMENMFAVRLSVSTFYMAMAALESKGFVIGKYREWTHEVQGQEMLCRIRCYTYAKPKEEASNDRP